MRKTSLTMRQKLFRGVKRLMVLLVFAVAAVLLLLWTDHRSPTILPQPTGRFPVGRASFDWIDTAHNDPLAPRPATKRELTVWIWYPASVGKTATPSPYLPTPLRAAQAQHLSPILRDWLSRDRSRVRCHSVDNPAVAPDQTAYPVLLMKPGIGALALDYTALCEDLASHGYIVVASDSPYNTFVVVYRDGRVVLRSNAAFPGGSNSTRVLSVWTSDNRFLLDCLTELNKHDPTGRFNGRLNLKEVGVFGHSFGGATAAEFCHEDSRCKAGVNIDGQPFGPVVNTGVNCPFMFLLEDSSGAQNAEDRQIIARLTAVYDHSSAGRRYVTVRGAGHFNFSDQSLLLNSILMQNAGGTGKIGARRGLRVTAACINTFFDVHLKGADPSLLERLPSQYPELYFGPGKP